MTSLLRILLTFLRSRLRFAHGYVKPVLGRLAFYLAFLGRRLSVWPLWRRLWYGGLGISRTKPGPAELPLPCARVRSSTHTVLGGSIGPNQNVMAASTVPASASLPILQDRETPTATTPSGCAIPSPDISNLTADYALHLASASDEGSSANRSTPNLDVYRNASDRLSIIMQSQNSLRAPVGQPSRLATRPEQGHVPLRSRARPSRSRFPTDGLHSPQRHEIYTSISSRTVVSETIGTAGPSMSDTQEPLNPNEHHGANRRKQCSTNVVVDTQNVSTDPLPNMSLMDPVPSTHEPFAAADPTTQSSAVFTAADTHEGAPQLTPTTCSIISDLHLPEGRFLRLINSSQISRHKKDITM
jgi:hypothetical protein